MSDFGVSYVLAGFDGPPPSVRALRWAAREARHRRLPVLVCHAWHPPAPMPPPDSRLAAGLRESAQRIVDKGLLIARGEAPYTNVRGVLKAGPAPDVLANQSAGAALAVVGAHEPTSFTRHAGLSPAVRLPAYGHCPVIVVRRSTRPGGPIVAGVDGSAAAETVLEFAYEEAALHERPIHVVHAYGETEKRVTAFGLLERLTSPWREKYPNVPFEESAVPRWPRDALFGAAEGAGLLVVGGRRLGDAGGFRLGGVTDAMVRDALCSVAVVRPRT
jgi:nucleotide-binding universal stress UspA family protein